jgi:hypothetical protein
MTDRTEEEGQNRRHLIYEAFQGLNGIGFFRVHERPQIRLKDKKLLIRNTNLPRGTRTLGIEFLRRRVHNVWR